MSDLGSYRLGEVIGSYRLEDVIGKGAMGVVYRATHTGDGRSVALKTVHGGDAAVFASLRREILALRRLDHPGVVRIVASGDHEGRPWYAMELVEGETLRAWIDALWRGTATSRPASAPEPTLMPTEAGPAPPGTTPEAPSTGPHLRLRAGAGRMGAVLTLTRHLCDALAFVHASGLVPRDLKPANVVVRPGGLPALLDFGIIARGQDALGRESLEGAVGVLGTVGYMAPEQLRGDLVDARVDLYALGCILYEGLTGRRPFESEQRRQLVELHLHAQPEPPSRHAEDVPAALDALVLGLLAKRPRDRIGHADDVARVLVACGAAPRGQPGSGPEGPSRAFAKAPDAPVATRGARAAMLFRPELAGRDEVLHAISARIDDAKKGNGSRIVVAAPSGLGRTRLAMEASRLAAARGLAVVTCECVASAANVGDGPQAAPLHPFRSFLRAVADRCRQRGAEETARLLGEGAKVLAPYEPALAELPGVAQAPSPRPLMPEDARRRIVRCMEDTILAFAASSPLLLMIDDLEWADELTLAVVAALQHERVAKSPLVFLATSRARRERSEALAVRAPGTLELALDPLGFDAVSTIVGDMLSLREPPARLVGFLLARTGGSPFLVVELLRAAVSEGLIARDDAGGWVARSDEGADAFETLALPSSAHALIVRRLDRLGAAARALVELASVAGAEFQLAVVLPLLALDGGPSAPGTAWDETPALDALRELIAQQIVEEREAGVHRFAHTPLRDVAYARIEAARKLALHRQLGLALERHTADQASRPYAALAHHFAQAGEHARALGYFEQAGEQAMGAYSNRAALAFFAEAVRRDDAAQDKVAPERRGRWERHMGEAGLALGLLAEGHQHLVDANRLFGFPTPTSKPGLAFGLAVETLVQLAYRAGLRGLFARLGPATIRDAPRERLLESAGACERVAEIAFLGNDQVALVYHMMRGLNLAERAGPSAELARGYANLCVGAAVAPMPGLSERYRARALAVAERLGDPVTSLDVLRLASIVRVGQARFAEAREAFTELLAGYERVGHGRRVVECATVHALGLQYAGELAASDVHFDRVQSAAIEIGAPMYDAWAKSSQAASLLDRGRIDDAAAHLEACVRILVTSRDQMSAVLTHGLLAEVRWHQGDRARAVREGLTTLALVERSPPASFSVLRGLTSLVTTFQAAWEASLKRAGAAADGARFGRLSFLARKALERHARVFPIGRAYLLLAQAAHHRIQGNDHQAQAFRERARAEAIRLGMPHPRTLADRGDDGSSGRA